MSLLFPIILNFQHQSFPRAPCNPKMYSTLLQTVAVVGVVCRRNSNSSSPGTPAQKPSCQSLNNNCKCIGLTTAAEMCHTGGAPTIFEVNSIPETTISSISGGPSSFPKDVDVVLQGLVRAFTPLPSPFPATHLWREERLAPNRFTHNENIICLSKVHSSVAPGGGGPGRVGGFL